MAYPQGAIVAAEDPFGNNPKRPYMVLSNEHVPFYGQEYIAVVVTTTGRPEAVEHETGELTIDLEAQPREFVQNLVSVLREQRHFVSEESPGEPGEDETEKTETETGDAPDEIQPRKNRVTGTVFRHEIEGEKKEWTRGEFVTALHKFSLIPSLSGDRVDSLLPQTSRISFDGCSVSQLLTHPSCDSMYSIAVQMSMTRMRPS